MVLSMVTSLPVAKGPCRYFVKLWLEKLLVLNLLCVEIVIMGSVEPMLCIVVRMSKLLVDGTRTLASIMLKLLLVISPVVHLGHR